MPARSRRARTRTLAPVILTVVAVILSACGGPVVSPADSGTDPGAPAQSGGPGTTVGGDAPGLTPEDATDAATAAHEDRLYREIYRGSGIEAEIGAETVAAIEGVRHELIIDALDKATASLVGRLASVGDPAGGPLRVLAVVMDFAGSMGTLTTLLGGQIDGSGTGGTQTSTTDTTFPFRGQQVTLSGTTITHVTANGSRVSASLESNISRTVRDANGQVVDSSTESTLATMELDACPAADGSVNATYSLEIIVTSASGSMRNHATGTVTGTVGDDALLQGFTIDAAAESSAVRSGSTVIDRAVTTRYSYQTAGGSTRGATMTGQPAVSVVRSLAGDPTSALVDLVVSANQPGLRIAISAFDRAQEAWRTGACVKIEAGDSAREVSPSAQVTITARVIHKIEGVELSKPIVATLAGPKSLDPAGTEVVAPADFTYGASSTVGDIGIVTLKTTSNRGIGTLDVWIVVVAPLQLEVRIESEISITKLNSFAADATAKVEGRILVTRNDTTGTWSGRGTLRSTTTSPTLGCNSITVTGRGSYDWVIREVVASPGLPESDLRIHMDSGPTSEQPDSFVAPICRSTTLTGTMNTWENLFFQVHRDEYGVKGFLVDNLSTDVPDTSEWTHGMELGSFGWFGTCEGAGGTIALIASCSALSTFGIWVVDPAQSPAP